MGKLVSSIDSARTASSELSSVESVEAKEISLGASTVKGMENGEQAGNQIVTNLNDLIQVTIKQSEKFPKIAEIFDVTDHQMKF